MEKQRILKLIEELPNDASIEDVMEKVYFHEVVNRGLEDIAAGRIVSHEEVKRRLGRRLEK